MRKLLQCILLILMFVIIQFVHAQDNFSNTKWQLVQINDSNVTNSPIAIQFYKEGRHDFFREANVCSGNFVANKDSMSFIYRGCTKTGGDKVFSLRIFEMIGPKPKYILSTNYLTFISSQGIVVFKKVVL